MASYQLQVITPQGLAYSGEVIHSLVPAETGFVGILANHAPFVTSSAGGRLEVREKNGQSKTFQVGEGFFEVAQNKAIFLTRSISN
jgi:F-type H+-transporting ATPase subunit epsilon